MIGINRLVALAKGTLGDIGANVIDVIGFVIHCYIIITSIPTAYCRYADAAGRVTSRDTEQIWMLVRFENAELATRSCKF